MLILDDSGAGKSTFSKYLETELPHSHNHAGPVSLFKNLSTIDRPDKDPVGEHLKTNNYSEGQIQELSSIANFSSSAMDTTRATWPSTCTQPTSSNALDSGIPRWLPAAGPSSLVKQSFHSRRHRSLQSPGYRPLPRGCDRALIQEPDRGLCPVVCPLKL